MVDKVAFTGSTETGRRVMKLAADTVKKVTLELGGKSPTIICDDADLSVAVDGALFGTFFHAGQVCESGTRCFVPASIYDEFMERVRERVTHITRRRHGGLRDHHGAGGLQGPAHARAGLHRDGAAGKGRAWCAAADGPAT